MIFLQNLFRCPTPARLTRVEKSLLQAHFHSVKYCQYNIIDPRTLIYLPSSISTIYYRTRFKLLESRESFCKFRQFKTLSALLFSTTIFNI
ncbi:hypothetical protein C7K03_06880 [Staphylococcus aureus]|nr:hypothetical protein C7K03_06880 [Staphylococcus aureus]